jgi:hypothetical protein
MKGKVIKILKYLGLFLLAFFVISVLGLFIVYKTQGEKFIYITPRVYDEKTMELFTIGYPERKTDTGKNVETYSTRFIFNSLNVENDNYVLGVSKRQTYHSTESGFYYNTISSTITIPKSEVANPDSLQTLAAGNFFDAKVTYEVDKGSFLYFLNYYTCGVQKVFANIFNIKVPCRRGLCQVKYIKPSWEFTAYSDEAKVGFLSKYEKDDLVVKLSSTFIADEWGYLSTPMKSMYQESIMPGGGYGMIGVSYDNSQHLKDSTKVWGMYFLSTLLKGNYQYYKDLDLQKYMYTNYQAADFSTEIVKDFMNCKSAYLAVKNLESCNTTECTTVKNSLGDFCSRTLVKLLDNFNKDYPDSLNKQASAVNIDKDTFGAGAKNYYSLSLPAEFLYAMKIEKILKTNLAVDPTMEKAKSSYNSAVDVYNTDKDMDQFLPLCFLMNSTIEMYNETKDSKYLTDANTIYEGKIDLTYLCSRVSTEISAIRSCLPFCFCRSFVNYATVKKTTETAERTIELSILGRYSVSPISTKMLSYDSARNRKEAERDCIYQEFGYFTSTVELEIKAN